MQRKSEMLAGWLIDLRSDLRLAWAHACMHRSGEEQIAPAAGTVRPAMHVSPPDSCAGGRALPRINSSFKAIVF
eukprot:SAG25_NODE_12921_length_273_cov_1.195402_1_plen_74_part_01